ncbi:hypothetical protein [Borrelia sp. P9F1]|uniref:hypothetical protein n=1 Tax=Borrelia sp. P9F1 TaxID=3058374 RepID=UPI00264794C7|nr:hypothetical protein [Borrelia sp. P9F1]WKC58693.1 hypothetical protein QYZ68_05675 [Borrelia sp. P9F1]
MFLMREVFFLKSRELFKGIAGAVVVLTGCARLVLIVLLDIIEFVLVLLEGVIDTFSGLFFSVNKLVQLLCLAILPKRANL